MNYWRCTIQKKNSLSIQSIDQTNFTKWNILIGVNSQRFTWIYAADVSVSTSFKFIRRAFREKTVELKLKKTKKMSSTAEWSVVGRSLIYRESLAICRTNCDNRLMLEWLQYLDSKWRFDRTKVTLGQPGLNIHTAVDLLNTYLFSKSKFNFAFKCYPEHIDFPYRWYRAYWPENYANWFVCYLGSYGITCPAEQILPNGKWVT